jgi:hypothetical protein
MALPKFWPEAADLSAHVIEKMQRDLAAQMKEEMEIMMLPPPRYILDMADPRYLIGTDVSAESGIAIAARRQREASQQRAEPRTATAVLERPKGEPWTLPPVMPDDEYLRVAAKLKLRTPAVIKAKLERFLVMRGWPVYPYDRVWAYLKSLAAKETEQRWGEGDWRPRVEPCWKPLRLGDRKQDGVFSSDVYPHAVPLHALLKVEELEDEFGPGALQFVVSDYEAVHPDPFLLVTAAGLPNYVIDVWDEPGFGV